MNQVNLIGRLTRDPEVRTAQNDLKVTKFTLAIDRPSKDKQADFPNIITFGKSAEIAEKFLHKGSQVGIEGRIQTGSYEKSDGTKVYTTDVIANRIELIGPKEERPKKDNQDAPMGFEDITDDAIPF